MNLVAANNFTSFTSLPSSGAKSSEGNIVYERIMDYVEKYNQSIAISGNKRVTNDELCDVYLECKNPNWDGYNAIPVSIEICKAALKFTQALPIDIPAPEVSAEADGEISFEWYQGTKKIFSVSIGANNRLSFAGIDGDEEWYGVSTFIDQISPKVISGIFSIII